MLNGKCDKSHFKSKVIKSKLLRIASFDQIFVGILKKSLGLRKSTIVVPDRRIANCRKLITMNEERLTAECFRLSATAIEFCPLPPIGVDILFR